MSLSFALFGDECAQDINEYPYESDAEQLTNQTDNKPTFLQSDGSFDKEINDTATKIQRRKRKSAPDDVQIAAEEYQKTKDERIWSRLYNRLYKPLLKYICTVVKDPVMAEDIVAVSFARANERIHEYDAAKSKFSTWLWTISYRQALYDMKIDARIDTVSIDKYTTSTNSAVENGFTLEIAADNGPENIDYYIVRDHKLISMDPGSITKKMYDASVNAISEIENPITREVVSRKILDELTIKEISTAMNLTLSNVKNHLYKGKSELVEHIKVKYQEIYELYLDAMHTVNNEMNTLIDY